MATKSITKNVTIKDNKAAISLANALEEAKRRKPSGVSFPNSVMEASRQDIAILFKDHS